MQGAVMAKIYDEITPELQTFIRAQPMFFVATAPLAHEGHVNLSPKGYDSLRVLSSQQVAYLDLTGSGNETSAHLAENGRITFMFCAFSGAPQILRLYGRGKTILPGMSRWDELVGLFPTYPGTRQIIVATIHLVQTSCGFAVPRMEFQQERDTLIRWAEAQGEDGLMTYRSGKNVESLDGMPTPLAQAYSQEPGEPR
jgi:hypothetical protein